jgi:DNA-binding response OmpR family regulator
VLSGGGAMNILIVEDEPGLRNALIELVRGAGHQAEAVEDGRSAVDRGTDPSFDLVLLDLMLPKLDGLDACRELREKRPDLFILMLTAKGSEEDKVVGLKEGADDYVTKPFGAKELLARIEAFERRARSRPALPEEIAFGDCRIDLSRCVVHRGHEEITLTAREAAILRLLYLRRARSVTRAEMLEEIWHVPGNLSTRTVDMTIANLRHKIERDPGSPEIIVTVKGVGYAWGTEA